MERYHRHIVLSEIGFDGQMKISNAKILVIGAGGLGCPALQYLAAAGIGTIGVIDFDNVNESNLQRQVLYGKSSLGKNKALAAKQRLEDLNDSIKINAYPEKLTYQNADSLFSMYDIVVDGTDNFESRYLINDVSLTTNTPLVYGGIFKFEGQVSVFNYQQGPSYRCLFPNPPEKDSIPNCSDVGVLGVLPGIIGSLQATEVIKIVLDLGDILSGKVLYYNSLTTRMWTINLERSQSEIKTVLDKGNLRLRKVSPPNNDVQTIPEISIREISSLDDYQFIDVRELHELPKVERLNVLRIPLHDIEHHIDQFNTKKNIALFCQKGIRSKVAVSILKGHKIDHCFSIKEGAEEIIESINKNSNNLFHERP
jgi:adenylyltransferase/sulfurtransferase